MRYLVFLIILAAIGFFAYQIIGNGLPFVNSPVSICQLKETPKKYVDRAQIKVSGKVTNSYSLFGKNLYELSNPDENCSIKVVSSGASPKEGKTLTIRGNLKEAFNIGNKRMLVIVEE